MYINSYALDVMTKTRLEGLRAEAARHTLLASLGTRRPGVWGALRSMLYRDGHRSGGQEIVSPRPA